MHALAGQGEDPWESVYSIVLAMPDMLPAGLVDKTLKILSALPVVVVLERKWLQLHLPLTWSIHRILCYNHLT